MFGSGKPVKALVRTTAVPAAVEDLKALGIEVVEGDLRDPASLTRACQGVATVISTATAISGHQPEDSISEIDLRGQRNLVDAAGASGVRHLIYTSFSGNLRTPEPLGDSKRAVERYLMDSQVVYTILRPTYFMEGWLSPFLGFDYSNAQARIYGSGRNPISWISLQDVAEFAARCVDNPDARAKVLELGGPEPLSPLAVVRIFEEAGGRPFTVEHVPDDLPVGATRAGRQRCLQERHRADARLRPRRRQGHDRGARGLPHPAHRCPRLRHPGPCPVDDANLRR